ncbi:MAG: hypothetical protein JRE23_17410 [Deltaproteobacteria bacterium]|nr:hypothetical protein [Deltaproteobacteria bacterium]
MTADQIYCSDLSLQAEGQIFGTATHTEAYLLLEYNGAWGKKAIPDSNLPLPIKAYLTEIEESSTALKTLLIIGQEKTQRKEIHLYIAVARGDKPSLYSFHLGSYEDLLDIDIPKVLIGEPQYGLQLSKKSIYLVCTHGRRDKCCAKFGLPVYETMETQASGSAEVWQSTHVGGHRFATNLLYLPDSLLYGRVNSENVYKILDAHGRRQVHYPNLRGRTCYDPIAQAAEHFLQQETGNTSVHAYRLAETEEVNPGEWAIMFRSTDIGQTHHLILRVVISDQQVYQGCGLDKQTHLKKYQLVSYQTLNAKDGG